MTQNFLGSIFHEIFSQRQRAPNSPLYKLFAPEYNDMLSEMVFYENDFPTEVIVSRLSFFVPKSILPEEAQKYGGEEHLRGFHAALTIMEASLYKSLDDQTSDFSAEIVLTNSITILDPGLMSLGKLFLDTGRLLILRDMSGKRCMEAIVNQLKGFSKDSNFQEGAEAAQDIFLAYWKVFERDGINLTDRHAPTKKK